MFKHITQATHFSAVVSSSKKVTVGHFSDLIRATYIDTALGINRSVSQTANPINHGWHQVALTSSGRLVVDGKEYFGTGSTSSTDNAGCVLGGRSDGSARPQIAFGEFAIIGSVLTTEQINGLWIAAAQRLTLPAGRNFYWSMEQESPDELVPGAAYLPDKRYSAALTSDQAYAGSQSLSVGTTGWTSVNFYNNRPWEQWATKDEGTIRLKFRYTGTLGEFLLFQFGGKDPSGINDTNDGIACKLTVSGMRLTYLGGGGANSTYKDLTTTVSPDAWHALECKWKRGAATTLSISMDGSSATSSSALTAMNALAIHQLQIGNDTANVPSGLWIDEVEVFGSWQE
jgi:hypothetical protein